MSHDERGQADKTFHMYTGLRIISYIKMKFAVTYMLIRKYIIDEIIYGEEGSCM